MDIKVIKSIKEIEKEINLCDYDEDIKRYLIFIIKNFYPILNKNYVVKILENGTYYIINGIEIEKVVDIGTLMITFKQYNYLTGCKFDFNAFLLKYKENIYDHLLIYEKKEVLYEKKEVLIKFNTNTNTNTKKKQERDISVLDIDF
jgi:hypothetical protein